ncbi:MAG: acetyl-CoA carboxylase carboxyltransferase subunit alpha [Kiritimatiellae bacterium]|nr:acetyl-CoA carboxylase carboxyltransferase subunit alpha [Kiritimatiellia bacterium]
MATKKTVKKAAPEKKACKCGCKGECKKSTCKCESKNVMDIVKLARDAKRPHLLDFVKYICEDFEELHGDRLVNDDRGLIGGFGSIDGVKCLILGHHKGATLDENMEANFGMANPDGYRKAMRLMKLAEKFHLPVVTFVDTPGAYPGKEAEERGQAEAIAKSLEFSSLLKTPIVVVITGEGGSGGALAIAVGDRILMLENAVYSVISPEGCAGILWRDGTKAPEAAQALKITAPDLKKLGAIDEIIPEPKGGAGANHKATALAVKKAVLAAIKELAKLPTDKLIDERYAKFRAMGNFYK